MPYWDDHVLIDDSPPTGYFGNGRCMRCGQEIIYRPRNEDDARLCHECEENEPCEPR